MHEMKTGIIGVDGSIEAINNFKDEPELILKLIREASIIIEKEYNLDIGELTRHMKELSQHIGSGGA